MNMITLGKALVPALALTSLVAAHGAEAALEGRYFTPGVTSGAFDAYYDTNLDVTWLADTNQFGLMSWDYVDNWVQTLVLAGVDEWRLPSFSDGSGDGSTGELYQLFVVELGNNADSQHPTLVYNPGPFRNVQYYITTGGGPTAAYWTDTAYGDGAYAWQTFNASYIAQSKEGLYWGYSVWLVHDGDVGYVAAVPEPEAYALMLAGLGLVAFAARRRRS
ncbi:MAG: PEP-CTERM sorting domain-containing protein [Pseudomonadota bacterium]